jgi:hypothetical protein
MTGGRFTGRLAFALAVLVLLCVGVGACGSQGGARRSASSGSRPLGDEDGDGAGDPGYLDGDDGEVSAFGRAADAITARAITALVGHYYAAAAAGDGARAPAHCCTTFSPNRCPKNTLAPRGRCTWRAQTAAVFYSRACSRISTLSWPRRHRHSGARQWRPR